MKKLLTAVLTAFLMATALSGQEVETLFGSTGLKLTGAWAGPVFGLTFFENGTAGTRGSFFGLEFNDVILLGFGTDKTSGPVRLKEGNVSRYHFKHSGFQLRIYPKKEKVIHPALGFMLGSGEVKDEAGQKDPVFVVRPTAGFEINVFDWCRVGLDAGYRFVSRTDLSEVEDGDFSTPFLQMKMRFGYSW